MKLHKIITLVLLVHLSSCGEDIFDRQPLDKISDAVVWDDPALVRAFATDLYARFPFRAFAVTQWHNYTDEATDSRGNSNSIAQGGASRTNDNLPYWDYVYLRDINTLIEKLQESPIAETQKRQVEGEARVMRAVYYFEMQKRYGGVPLVDVVLDPFEEIDSRFSSRDTEEAIADFIDNELTVAAELLNDDAEPKGRINKWTAYAYKARANLWSASIAKYGSVQIGGLVGIPEGRANEFFQKASQAAEAVISSGKYSLYNKIPERSENYRNLFLDPQNDEVIFKRIYDGVNIGHSWHQINVPPSFSLGRGGTDNPLLEFILSFENIDGSDEQPAFGVDHLYDDGYGPFANKDPRLKATVFFQGDPYGGGVVDTYEGIDPSAEPDPSTIISSPAITYQGMETVGKDSRMLTSDEKGTNSGFIIKKYIEDEPFIAGGLSTVDWIALRLAEMYLTRAEAEFELGNTQEAVDALNATRERAGISLVDAGNVSLDRIRNERKVELSFEQHRWWDLKRWRLSEQVLNGRVFSGLRIIYHYDSDKYYFLPIEAEVRARIFRPEHYYNPITDGRINNNADLVENPLY